MKFVVIYEIPPMRGFFRMVVSAENEREVEEKFRLIDEAGEYRIKEVKKLFMS